MSVECLTKRLKMHQKYLRYRMVVILSLKDKSKRRKYLPGGIAQATVKRKSRNYFVVPAFFNAVSMAWTISWEV